MVVKTWPNWPAIDIENLEGFNIAGTGTNEDVGNPDWPNPGRITADDDSRSSVGVAGGGSSDWLHATNFGFAIPSNYISTEILRLRFIGFRTLNQTANIFHQVLVADTRVGSSASVGNTPVFSGSDQTHDIDYNDHPALTEAEIEATGFGMALKAGTTFDPNTINCDSVHLQVEYTTLGGGAAWQSVLMYGISMLVPLIGLGNTQSLIKKLLPTKRAVTPWSRVAAPA